MYLLLIRHGRTAFNAQRRFLGRTDVALDGVGRSEASLLAPHLASRVNATYSSPLIRAVQTARGMGHEPVLHPGLMEIDVGDLEGLDLETASLRYPDFFTRWQADPTGVCVPGGESLNTCQHRASTALLDIAALHGPDEVVAVVTHQIVIATLRCWMERVPLSAWSARLVSNASVTAVAWGNTPVVHIAGWLPSDDVALDAFLASPSP